MIAFDQDRPIFVMASGPRCGSTLLQRLLNSHDQVLIWGEQNGFLNALVHGYRDLIDWKTMYHHHRDIYLEEGYDTFSPNLLPLEEELFGAAQWFIRSLFADPARNFCKTRWGFKEVKYDATIAKFLNVLFPNASVVHLTRDVVDCFISLKHWENAPGSWTRQDTLREIEAWQRVNSSFLALRGPESWHMTVRYEDLVGKRPTEVARICAFLGLAADDLDLDVFERRLHEDGAAGREERPVIHRTSLTDDERALLSQPPIPEIRAALGYAIDFDNE